MKGNIYLSGGGLSKDTYELDDLFLKEAGEKILYIPVGLKRTFAGYDGCIEWFMDMLRLHNVTKGVTTWVNLKNKDFLVSVNKFDAIYIGGASDTFRLHSILSTCNMYRPLIDFVNNGGILYGGSGGATVLGKTINYDQAEKQLPLVEDLCANVCEGYSIFTHFNQSRFNFLKGIKFGNLIIIPEKNGVVINKEKKTVQHIGNDSVYLLSDDFIKELKNKESFIIYNASICEQMNEQH